jgi:hypothetical protein
MKIFQAIRSLQLELAFKDKFEQIECALQLADHGPRRWEVQADIVEAIAEISLLRVLRPFPQHQVLAEKISYDAKPKLHWPWEPKGQREQG